MYIPQFQLKNLEDHVVPNKVVVIYGPRRVGKTTLLKKYLEDKKDYIFVTGEDIFANEYLASGSIEKLKSFVGGKKLVIIDEAQYITNIGLNLKLMVDQIEGLKIIATGSSTFDLIKNVGEPLTGRKHVIKMFPISQIELNEIENNMQVQANLEQRLIFGLYPEVVTSLNEKSKREYLHELVSSYLLKDILAFEGLKNSQKLVDLLILLAFQIGKEVSLSEIATQLSINKATIEKYLDLLQQVFVIVNIRGFSRNLRKEVTKTSRYYFCDNGIRNALINNFNPLNRRDDIGMLWENYLSMERIKFQNYKNIYSNNYFWRTYDQKELDWVEERDGNLFGYEFKYNEKTCRAPDLWIKTYPNSSFECINKKNYINFIS